LQRPIKLHGQNSFTQRRARERRGAKRLGPVQASAMAVQFASRLSLIAFATVSFRGMLTSIDFEGSLKAALIAAAGFYGLGLVLGELARRVVEESVASELSNLEAANVIVPK
jgi:hypothetical protein